MKLWGFLYEKQSELVGQSRTEQFIIYLADKIKKTIGSVLRPIEKDKTNAKTRLVKETIMEEFVHPANKTGLLAKK